MKKLVLYLILSLLFISCGTTVKQIEKEKKESQVEQKVETKKEDIASEKVSEKENVNINTNVTDTGTEIKVTPIDSTKPSFFEDPDTGKKINFQNSTISYKKKKEQKTVADNTQKVLEKKTDQKSNTFQAENTSNSQSNDSVSKNIKKENQFPTFYFSIFVLLILIALFIYKRKSFLGLVAKVF